MRFSNRLWSGVLAVLLIGAAARGQQRPHIIVVVSDTVGVAPSLLLRSEDEAARLFEIAGIEIEWHNCGRYIQEDVEDCSVHGTNRLVLHIVHTGLAVRDSVFGVAFIGEDGRGKYSDVFFDRIREEALGSTVPLAQLLAAVSAHELGHLLLGTHSHSPVGIMEARWQKQSLGKIAMGSLYFTREQSRLMQQRFDRRTFPVQMTSFGRRGFTKSREY